MIYWYMVLMVFKQTTRTMGDVWFCVLYILNGPEGLTYFNVILNDPDGLPCTIKRHLACLKAIACVIMLLCFLIQ